MHLPRKMKKKKTLGYIWGLWGIAGIMSVAVILSVRYFPLLLKSHTNAQSVVGLGEYGDIYGGLNTLFTGLAFVGLVVTILLQRQEMKETREEFEAQTEQFEEQTRLLNEQIEEQKRANEKQFQLAIDAQHKEELFKRLEYIKRLETEISIENAYAVWRGNDWERKVQNTFNGERALLLMYFTCTGFLEAINSPKELTKVEINQIQEEQTSLYLVVAKLSAWLIDLYDFMKDANRYFEHNRDEVSKFWRLVLNPLSSESRALLLMLCGKPMPAECIEAAFEEKILSINPDVFHSIFLDEKAKSLLWQYANLEIFVEDAKEEWQEYVRESGAHYSTSLYRARRPEYS